MTIDLMKEQPDLYEPSVEPTFVEVPNMRFLSVDGTGAPDADVYQHAIQAIYAMAYGLKFCLRDKDLDFRVMPLETLWWSDDETAYRAMDLARWQWSAMLRVPEAVCEDCYQLCWEKAAARSESPSFGNMRMEDWEEGRAIQVLHTGPWTDELPTVEKLHAFIAEYGGQPRGRHHEIYLSDPRRTKPAHLRTILRQPIL